MMKSGISKKYKITSGVYIAIVVLILVVVNIAASFLPFKIDFTENRAFSLSGECRDMIRAVDTDIEIIACRDRIAFTSNVYLSNIAQTVESMAAENPHIAVTFKSVDKNPALKEEYPTASLTTNHLIVRRADDAGRYKVLNINNMFELTDDGNAIRESKVEYTIANAIDYCNRDSFPTLYYTKNHLEDYPAAFLTLMAGNNYAVREINLLTDDLPADAGYLFLFNPKTDFAAAELDRLDAFLNNGGAYGKNLFVFLSPEQPALPMLETYLGEWGIGVGSGILYNPVYSADSEYETMLLSFGDAEAAGPLYESVNLIGAQTRPLSLLFSDRDYAATTALLNTAPETRLVADSAAGRDPAKDETVSCPVLAMGTKYQKQSNAVQSHIVVSGSYQFISDAFMSSSYGNAAYLSQLINYLDPDNAKLFIFPKNMETPLLSFSSTADKTAALILFGVVLPLAVAAAGLIVYLKRRHR